MSKKQTEALYHLTNETSYKDILKNGLIPLIGENSKLCKETTPYIYLCDKNSIPYWNILLNKPVLLKIPYAAIPDKELFRYSLYKEYLVTTPIPPEHIIRTKSEKTTSTHMESLCMDYLYSISQTCCNIARYYEYSTEYEKLQEIEQDIKILLHNLKKLDYHICKEEDIIKLLKDDGENGSYTFADTYKNTKERLWSQLILYPNDELSDYRKELYDWIQQTFSNKILYTNTGGWTG